MASAAAIRRRGSANNARIAAKQRRQKILVVVLAFVVALVAACSDNSGRPDDRRIRVGHVGALDFSDMPAEIAHDALRADGYVVVLQAYPTVEVLADALARGDVDIGAGSTRSFWAAIGRGAPIRSVMEHVANIHRLIATATTPGCAAYSDRRFALQSEGAAGTDDVVDVCLQP